jgi:uncharacterized membrane protein required for colicin V production
MGTGTLIGNLITLAAVGGLGFLGFKKGLFYALTVGLMGIVAVFAAFTFGDFVADLVGMIGISSEDIRATIGFALTFLVFFMLCRQFVVANLAEEGVFYQKIIDKAGGALFGAGAGIVTAGIILLFWSYIPFNGQLLIIPEDKLMYDSGAKLIQLYGHLANDVIPGGVKFNTAESIQSYRTADVRNLQAVQPGLSAPKSGQTPAAGGSGAPAPQNKGGGTVKQGLNRMIHPDKAP